MAQSNKKSDDSSTWKQTFFQRRMLRIGDQGYGCHQLDAQGNNLPSLPCYDSVFSLGTLTCSLTPDHDIDVRWPCINRDLHTYPLASLGYTNAVGATEVWIPSNIYLWIDIVWDRSIQWWCSQRVWNKVFDSLDLIRNIHRMINQSPMNLTCFQW